jgi:hypothetical protein
MARRGRNIFLVLIAPIVVDCTAAIVVALRGEWQSIHWTASVLTPLWIVGWIGFLYLLGYRSSLVVVEFCCLLPGIGLIIQGIQDGSSLAPGGPWGHLAGCPSVVVVAIGAWYFTAGLALMLVPSVRAYFAHQRKKAAAAMNPTTAE